MDLAELEAAAKAKLDPAVYDYIAGAAMDEITLAENDAAWRALRLRPRIFRDVTNVSTGTTILGAPVAHPIAIAPTAFHRLAHDNGEPETARGARQAGALFTMSTRATASVADVAAACGDAPWWFQIYVLNDRAISDRLIDEAVAGGARALVLTADTPVLGRRLRDVRNKWVLPTNLGTIESLEGEGNLSDQNAGVTFDEITAVRDRWGLPVVVKGVHRGDDARRCVDAGASAVWVSNHGGRQLDGAIASAHALPEVVEAVGGRHGVEVYVDGGIRRGTDVLRALALGARAVFIGRPFIWGLAVGGAAGVCEVLSGFAEELALAMALAGCPAVTDITADLINAG